MSESRRGAVYAEIGTGKTGHRRSVPTKEQKIDLVNYLITFANASGFVESYGRAYGDIDASDLPIMLDGLRDVLVEAIENGEY